MQWPQELTFLSTSHRTHQREFLLRGIMVLTASLLVLNALLNLLTVLCPVTWPWWAAANFALTLLLLTYLRRRQPSVLTVARRLDRQLQSAERIQTYLEVVHNHTATTQAAMSLPLLQELQRYFKQHPPVVHWQWQAMRPLVCLVVLALLLFAVTFWAVPALSQAMMAQQELEDQKSEALAAFDEVADSLAEEPLLESLKPELEQLRAQIVSSEELQEVAVLLQEALEVLEQERETLTELAEALQKGKELLSGGTAAELAAQLTGDPAARAELVETLTDLLDEVPAGTKQQSLAKAVNELKSEAANPSATAVSAVQAALQEVDPNMATAALQQGTAKLRAQQQTIGTDSKGVGNSQTEAGNLPPGEGAAGEGEGNASGDGGGPGTGQAANNGTGQNSGGAGTGSGQGEGSGAGAGTGDGPAAEQEFFFIPGEQEVTLTGGGEEGQYTLQEIIRYSPQLSPTDYEQSYRHYYQQGRASLQGGQIPAPLTEYVQHYFEAIAP